MDYIMSQPHLRNSLLLITYSILLVLALLKFDLILSALLALLSALTPLFLGFAIAFVLSTPCNVIEKWLQRHTPDRADQYARPIAVLSAYILLIVVIGGLLSFVIPQIGDSILVFLGRLEGAVLNLQATVSAIINTLDLEMLKNINLDFSQLSGYINQILSSMADSMGNAAGHMVALTSALFGYVVTLVLSIVFSIYILSSGDNLYCQYHRIVRAYLPPTHAQRVIRITDISRTTFSNFISGQLTEAVILGGLCTLGTLFIQADYAPLIGVIIGISALIPVAGAYLGAILGAFLLLMVSPYKALIFLIFLTVLQQIEGNIIYPRVVGTSIGLPGIWVLAAVTVGGGLFGLLGILLAVPIVSILYTLLREDVNTRLSPQESPSESQEN